MNAGELVISLLLKAGSFKSDLASAQSELDRTGAAGESAMVKIAAALSGLDGAFTENADGFHFLETCMKRAGLTGEATIEELENAVASTINSFEDAFDEIENIASDAGLSAGASFVEIEKAAANAGLGGQQAFEKIQGAILALGANASATLEDLCDLSTQAGDAASDALDMIGETARQAGASADSSIDQIADSLDEMGAKARQAGNELENAAKKGSSGFKSLMPVLTKVAGFIGVGLSFKGLVSDYLDQADALGKYSDALNLNVEDVQAWEEAVKHAGGNGEAFRSTLQNMTANLTQNKTATPVNVGVVVARTGSPDELSSIMKALDGLVENTDLVSIVTPEKTFVDFNLVSYDYDRKTENGVDRLLVSLSFEEIRQVEPEYGNEQIPPVKKPRQPSDKSAKQAGKQTTSKASEPVKERTSSRDLLNKKHDSLGAKYTNIGK